MRKYLATFLFLATTLFAQNHPYFISDKHGYIQKNLVDLSYAKLQMNDSVDILKIKQSELGSNTISDAAIGDMSGNEYSIRYKVYDKAMAVLKYQDTNISYGLGDLNNKKTEFFIRHNLISKVFALDFGITQNKSNNISSDRLTNRVISSANIGARVIPNPDYPHPILPMKPYLVVDNNNQPFQDPQGNQITIQTDNNNLTDVVKEYIKSIDITNLKDDTLYLRAIRSFVEDDIYSFDVFVEYAHTKVSSFIDIQTTQSQFSDEINKQIAKKNIQNLNRKEQRLTFGAGHSWFVNRWFMDIVFSMDYIKRDTNLSKHNKNMKLEANLGYKIFDNTTFFIGAKVMTNQFVGEIPYLYNEYTQNSFDKKYGWAKTGLIFSF